MQKALNIDTMPPESSDNLPEVSDAFNRANDRAVINLLPPGFQSALLRAHAARPELFGLDEAELVKASGCGERGFGATANALRMKFWNEYDEAQMEHRQMKPVRIYSGVCEPEALAKKLQVPEVAAWILTRPADYATATREMHQFSMQKMRKILEADVGTTKIDTKLGELQFKIFMALDTRVEGAVVQKTMNLHAKVPGKADVSASSKKEDLEKRIKQLERDAERNQGKIIDAKSVDAE